ncbi:MAG TPA: SpoIIE family protein phosphatase [Thermoleophilaceae bacterium]|nr:SpoIIE family protein phosphatase [Thermoleophilaceae bacterium]
MPRLAALGELFARSEEPDQGADIDTARKLVGMLWGLSAVLSAAFLAFASPDVAFGDAGWPAAILIVALSTAGARWVSESEFDFRQLLMISYLGLAQTALLQWLAGGAAPYRALFLLWLGSGVGVHNARRGASFIPVVIGFGSLPLLYSHAPHIAAGIATDALLWLATGLALLFLIQRVRKQRAAMMSIERDARERAEEAVKKVRGLEAVADAGLAHLPFDELLSELLARVSRVLEVEHAAILLKDDERQCLTVRAARGPGAELAQSHRVPLGAGIAGQVAAEKRPVFVEASGADPVPASVIWQDRVRSVLAVPLLVEGGRVIGVLQVGSSEGRSFSDNDIQLLQLAADRLAVAIDRARLNEQAHHIAATLQRSLLPSSTPDVPGLELATRYQPGADGTQVGGDLYDVVPYSDGRVGLAIGDVVGRGIEAASLMGQIRNSLRAYAMEDDRPDHVIERLNLLMHHWQQDRIATLSYLVLDPRNGHVVFATAGHLPPLVLGPDGNASYLEGGEFVPLGVLPFGGYTAGEAVVKPGSTVLLYTDGLVEERGMSIDDGLERLREAIQRAPADPDAMCDFLLREVPPNGAAGDDVAVLATRLVPVNLTQLNLKLPAEPESLALMRRALERWLGAIGVPEDTACELKVACGEACMNAVEHAYPPGDAVFEVRALNLGENVEIVVRDFGFWRPPRAGSDRGRGLELMKRLTDSMKVVPGSEGTTVHLLKAVRKAAFV